MNLVTLANLLIWLNLADMVDFVNLAHLVDLASDSGDSSNSVDFVESGGYVGPGESGCS